MAFCNKAQRTFLPVVGFLMNKINLRLYVARLKTDFYDHQIFKKAVLVDHSGLRIFKNYL